MSKPTVKEEIKKYKKILKSGTYPEKKKALGKMRRINEGFIEYQICPVCKCVGRLYFRKNRHGNEHQYFYHYTPKEGPRQCSYYKHDMDKKKKEKEVLCPKCHKKGTYHLRSETDKVKISGVPLRTYLVKRTVVKHGGRTCFINRAQLDWLREKYDFVRQKTVRKARPAYDNPDDPDRKRYHTKLQRDVKMKGFELAEFTIRIYEGHKKAKAEGKKIGYDVDKKLADLRKLLKWAKKTNDPGLLSRSLTSKEYKIISPYEYGRELKSRKKARQQ